MKTRTEELFDAYHSTRRRLNKTQREYRKFLVKKSKEYKLLVEHICKLKKSLCLAKKQQRLMSKEIETDEIKLLKQNVRDLWTAYVEESRKEREGLFGETK